MQDYIFMEHDRIVELPDEIDLSVVSYSELVSVSWHAIQRFKNKSINTIKELHQKIITASTHRLRPALMTSATTMLALLPVLTAKGRGADIMVPMAIPSFGGMVVVLITIFVVPVLYCAVEERRLLKTQKKGQHENK